MWYLAIGAAAAAFVAAQDCGPITSSYDIGQGEVRTVQAQETAVGANGPTAVVLPCGQASMGVSADVTLSGGTATISGEPWWPQRATVTVPPSNTGSLVRLMNADITIQQGASAQVDSASWVSGRVDASATLNFQTGYNLQFTVGGTISATGSELVFHGETPGAQMYGSGTLLQGLVYTSGATVTVEGTSVFGYITGGVGTVRGDQVYCTVTAGGYCRLEGTGGSLDCADASADVYGSGVIVGFENGCDGTVSGAGGQAYVYPGARVTLMGGAGGLIYSGAGAYVRSGASEVFLEYSATVTMEAGARVSGYMLDPNQLVPAAPGVQITASSQDRFNTIYEARNVGTLRRRAALPAPTGSCDVGKTTCPDLRGGTRCVDIRTDIFNCGGCNFGPNSVQVGIDCSTVFDGNVQCINGQCVENSV